MLWVSVGGWPDQARVRRVEHRRTPDVQLRSDGDAED
jgi:hypothetical protein